VKRQLHTLSVLGFALVAGLLPQTVRANIVGELNIAGNAVISGAGAAGRVSFATLPNPPGNGSETFAILGSTGFFQTPIPGSDGAGTELPFISLLAEPINTIVNVPNFLTFTGVPGVSFTLTEVFGGVDGTANCSDNPALAVGGQQCSPAGTPFNLNNLSSTTSSAQFRIMGNFITPGGVVTPAIGVFTAASVTGSFQQLILNAENNGSTTVSYGAQFDTIVPEPNLGFLSCICGAGLVAIGWVGNRRSRSKS